MIQISLLNIHFIYIVYTILCTGDIKMCKSYNIVPCSSKFWWYSKHVQNYLEILSERWAEIRWEGGGDQVTYAHCRIPHQLRSCWLLAGGMWAKMSLLCWGRNVFLSFPLFAGMKYSVRSEILERHWGTKWSWGREIRIPHLSNLT